MEMDKHERQVELCTFSHTSPMPLVYTSSHFEIQIEDFFTFGLINCLFALYCNAVAQNYFKVILFSDM
jgi:hypothetical protein